MSAVKFRANHTEQNGSLHCSMPMHALPSPTADRRLRLLQEIAARLRAEMSPRQILAGIATTLREHHDWDYVGCASVDATAGRIRYDAHAPRDALDLPLGHQQRIGVGIMGEVAWCAQPLCIDDVSLHPNYVAAIPGTRSELCVPVIHQGDVIAVLDAQSRHPRAFTDDDRQTLALVAELLGGSMAAAQQLEAARQRAEVIALLADVSRAMLAEDDLDAMLQRLVDELHRCFQLSLSTLCLRDDEERLRLRAFAGHSLYPLRCGEPWKQQHGVTGRAMRSGKRVYVPDVRRDPDYLEGNPDTVAELVVPIRFRDQVLGFLNLESPCSGTFSPSNQLAVQALADQAAGAIRLAMTMQRLRETRQAEERTAAALARSHQRLERANRRLREMSLRDPLTGLGNRRRLDRGLKQAWRDALLGGQVSLLLLDIDHYKAYNDLYGHGQGDLCLVQVGRALRLATRRLQAVVARYGGEEFAVLLPATDAALALAVAERIQSGIAALALVHAASPTAQHITVSIGVATLRPRAEGLPDDLLARADAALYAAKRDGRNRIVVT